jgi:hypothetical protein
MSFVFYLTSAVQVNVIPPDPSSVACLAGAVAVGRFRSAARHHGPEKMVG